MILGKQPKSLDETIKYQRFLETYKPRVEAAIQAVDVYTAAVAAQDQKGSDLNSTPGVVAFAGASRYSLGLSTGANTGPWPPLPHPGCSKSVEYIDAFMICSGTQKLELHEQGGRDINWAQNSQGFESVYSINDKQGTLVFGRVGENITMLEPAVGGSPEIPS